MSNDLKKAYADKMEAQLKEWGAMFDVIKARVAKGTADVRVKYHQQLDEWTEKESDFKKKLAELKEAGEEKFEALKNGVHTAWEEISSFVKSTTEKVEDKVKETVEDIKEKK